MSCDPDNNWVCYYSHVTTVIAIASSMIEQTLVPLLQRGAALATFCWPKLIGAGIGTSLGGLISMSIERRISETRNVPHV